MAIALFMSGMLVDYIPDNCIKVPEDPDDHESWKADDYPYFSVFCSLHLATGMEYSTIESNARIIGGLTEEQIRTFTLDDLKAAGCELYSATNWD